MIILVPNVMKRRSRTVGEIGSISHFHQQLRVLEQSGPTPIVAPAYRLRAVDGSGDPTVGPSAINPAPVLTVVGADPRPRPALAFLGDDLPAPAGPGDDDLRHPGFDGESGAAPVVAGDPRALPGRSGDPSHRYTVRRRRRDTLGVLFGLFVVTLLLGFVPGASAAWAVTALAAVALGAYMAFLVHLRRMAEERDRKLHYLDQDAYRRGRVPVTVSGRYAHPSSQTAVAR
jgi:hypothetical protein